MKRMVIAGAIAALQFLTGPVHAQSGDEDRAWVSDEDGKFVYLAFSVPESDDFSIAFACELKSKRTYVVLRETEESSKVGRKFPLTLQVGDVKTTVKAATTFDKTENMLRSIAPINLKNDIFLALNGVDPLVIIRDGTTKSYPLTDIKDRLREFQDGCGKKRR